MTTIGGHRKFLEAFACAHVNDGFMDDNGERMLGNFMKFQGSSLNEIKDLKERGNGFFRQKYFDMAAACYDEACKLLGLIIGVVGSEDVQSLSELAVSLNSNLAACALKLDEFQATLDLCSIILNSFPRNVKALFRRALAFMKLKRFFEAELDLVEALVVEPKNKDVLRELGVVRSHLLMKENGKRVLEVAPIVDVDRKKKLVCASEPFLSARDCLTDKMDLSVRDCVAGKMEVTDVPKNNHDFNLVKSIEVNEGVVIEMKDAQNNCGVDLCTNLAKTEYVADKSSSLLEFSKKGGGNSRLRIAGQSYKKLLEGKKVSFYHKRDLSTITIRILDNEKTKEEDTTREKCKKKRRRRCHKKRKLVAMNSDLSPLDINNVKPLVPDASSSTSSICDNFTTVDTQILQLPNTVVSHDSILPSFPNTDDTTSVRTQAQYDANVNQPFLFSAYPKKCKMHSPSVNKLSSAPRTSKLCRYPLRRFDKLKKRILNSKKISSQGDESPRHILSTFSTSRSFTHKFLRPRGVSMSCCRYSSEAQLIRKRKEMFAQLANSDRPLKKPTLIITPTLSLVFSRIM